MRSRHIARHTGVHPNTRCAVCKITAAKSFEKGPVDTGINHPIYKETYSFYSWGDGKHVCPRCHRENELKTLFEAMDKRDDRMKALLKVK